MQASEAKHWVCRDRRLSYGETPLIMGILNVTPDSFYDGGRNDRCEQAVAVAGRMLAEGADIIDVGGESTRPGAAAVDAREEMRRVVPVVERLCAELGAVVSIDTSKAEVAEAALKAGAHIVNDVTALSGDAAMAGVAAEYGAGTVLMHMQGTPRTMQDNPAYSNVRAEVAAYLHDRMEVALANGIARESIALDPGIGFGKSPEHNLELLADFRELKRGNAAVLVGLSRKSFIGMVSGAAVEERLPGSLAGLACAVLAGADILRVHDVAESRQAALVAAAVRRSR